MSTPQGGFQQSSQPNNLQLPASAIHLNTKYWINEGLPYNFPFQVNVRLPEHLYQYVPAIAGHIAYYLQQNANISAARIFSYNLYSRDGYSTERFSTLVANAVEYFEVLVSGQGMPIEAAFNKVGDEFSILGTAGLVREFTPIRKLCTKEVVHIADTLASRMHEIANEKANFYRARNQIIPNSPPPQQPGANRMYRNQQQAQQNQNYPQQQQGQWQQQNQGYPQQNQWPPQQQQYPQQQGGYPQQNQDPWPPLPQQQMQGGYPQQQQGQWQQQNQGYPQQQQQQYRTTGYIQPQYHNTQQNQGYPQQQNQWPPQQQGQWPQQMQSGYPQQQQGQWQQQNQGYPQQNQWPPQQQQYPQQQGEYPQQNQWPPQQQPQGQWPQQMQGRYPQQLSQQPQTAFQQPNPQPITPATTGVRTSALTNFIPVKRTNSNLRPVAAVTQRLGDNGYEDFRTDAEVNRDNQRSVERQRELAEVVVAAGGMVNTPRADNVTVSAAPWPKVPAAIETWDKVYEPEDSFANNLFREIEKYEEERAAFVHPLTPEQQQKFNIPNRPIPNGESTIINTATGKPLPKAEAKSRPYDSITTKGGVIKPAHLTNWVRTWNTDNPFDAAWDPSTQVKFLRNDGEEIHEMIQPMVPAMDYLKHETNANLKRNLPVDESKGKIVANFDLLNTLHEVSEETDADLKALKISDIKTSSDTLKIPKIFNVCEGTSAFFDASLYLMENDLESEMYRRPVEVMYYGAKLYINMAVGETSLKGIIEAIDEIETVDDYVRYLRRLELSGKVTDHFLSELIEHSTRELNKALTVGMNMGFDVDNILEDWINVKKEFYEELGEEIGNEHLTKLEVEFGHRIITGGRELADPEELEEMLSPTGLYSRYGKWKDKLFIMMTKNTETYVPWRAGDISLCMTESKGVIFESVLPNLFASIKAVVERNNKGHTVYKHRYIRTADSKKLDIHVGASKDHYILEEVS